MRCSKCGKETQVVCLCGKCNECGFNLTEKEVDKITWEDDNRISYKMKKSILKRKLKKALNKLRSRIG